MKPCDQCPWRLANQGKRHAYGFYTLTNLRRLWNQVRRGGRAQSCHLTDPTHPDHVKAGAKPGSKPKECPGSVIVVLREVNAMADETRTVTPESVAAYQKKRKGGLTKSGIAYWVVQRIQLGKVPFLGEGELPEVDMSDAEVGLPASLGEG